MGKLVNKITDTLIENGTVSEKDRDVYHYCITGVVEMGMALIVTLVLSLIMGKLTETLLFLLIIIPLRSIAGGYHANSGRMCFLLSVLFYLSAIFMSAFIYKHLDVKYSLWIYITFSVLILIEAPVDSKNKRLSAEEKSELKRKCLFLFLPFSLFFAVLWLLTIKLSFDLSGFCYLMSCCMVLVFLMMTAGKIKNKAGK